MKNPTYWVLLNDTNNALGIYDTQEKALAIKMDMNQWHVRHVYLREAGTRKAINFISKWLRTGV